MFRLIFVLMLALGLSSPALAQDQASDGGQARMAELRAALAPGKQIFIARQTNLSPAEEASFWPIYDEHQQGLAELAARRRANIASLARVVTSSVDEDDAEELTAEALAIEADEARLLARTHSRMERAVGAAKALNYLRLELKLAALARYEAAAALP